MTLFSRAANSIHEISRHIVLFFITAVAGGFISYMVNLSIDWYRNTSKLNIDGKWLSVSCDRTAQDQKFVAFDVVNINTTLLNGVKISNIANKKLNEYKYSGQGSVFNGKFFHGTWASANSGANTKGAFSFTISPQGDALVGSFTGDDELGPYTQCWIMGRNEKSLIKGYNLSKSQIVIPDDMPFVIPNELRNSFSKS
jgi:hypothetical protein